MLCYKETIFDYFLKGGWQKCGVHLEKGGKETDIMF